MTGKTNPAVVLLGAAGLAITVLILALGTCAPLADPRTSAGDDSEAVRARPRRGPSDGVAAPAARAERASPREVPPDASAEHQGASRSADRPSPPSPQDEIDSVGSLIAFLGRRRPAGPDHSLVGDRERFAALFRPSVEGPTIAIDADPLPHPMPRGSRLEFAAGRHEIEGHRLTEIPGLESVSDLTLSGAGMDRTLVVLSTPFRLPHGTAGFSLEDMTIDCNDACLVEGQGTVVLRIERCRVLGFDGPRGAHRMIQADGAAVLAERSRFESGFGSAPGFARLFNTSSSYEGVHYPTLARFEDCAFVGPFTADRATGRAFYRLSTAQSAVFERCELVGCTDADRAEIASPLGGGRFVDCHVPPSNVDPAAPRERRSVAEFDAAWIRASADGPEPK